MRRVRMRYASVFARRDFFSIVVPPTSKRYWSFSVYAYGMRTSYLRRFSPLSNLDLRMLFVTGFPPFLYSSTAYFHWTYCTVWGARHTNRGAQIHNRLIEHMGLPSRGNAVRYTPQEAVRLL